MIVREGFVDNNGVRIHYIDSNPTEHLAGTTLFICPGLSETAEDYLSLAKSLFPRRVVVLSFRGRGKSESPEIGYSLEHHISDIDAVVKDIGLQKFCLMGYSRGVSYALGFGLANTNSLNGMIIEDYPAQHKQMPNGWAEEYLSFLTASYPTNKIDSKAVLGIEEESNQVYFWPQLYTINCPVLIMRGGQPGSLLSSDDFDMYLESWKDARVEVFEHAGHDIQSDCNNKFVEVIKDFLKELD